MDRYFFESPIVTDRVTLGGAEAHHLIHVMRRRRLRVVLFDGSGGEFAATVTRSRPQRSRVCRRAAGEVDRELPFELTLGVALPKGDRQKWLVEKRSSWASRGSCRSRPPGASRSRWPGALERLRRGVIEASKQCGRNRLMEIATPAAWNDFLAATAAMPLRLLAHPDFAAPLSRPQRRTTVKGLVGGRGAGGEGWSQCQQPSPPTPLPVAGEATVVSCCGRIVSLSCNRARGARAPRAGPTSRRSRRRAGRRVHRRRGGRRPNSRLAARRPRAAHPPRRNGRHRPGSRSLIVRVPGALRAEASTPQAPDEPGRPRSGSAVPQPPTAAPRPILVLEIAGHCCENCARCFTVPRSLATRQM